MKFSKEIINSISNKIEEIADINAPEGFSDYKIQFNNGVIEVYYESWWCNELDTEYYEFEWSDLNKTKEDLQSEYKNRLQKKEEQKRKYEEEQKRKDHEKKEKQDREEYERLKKKYNEH